MTLALFDFDGTITRKDSFRDFIVFSRGISGLVKAIPFLAPFILLYLLKLLPNDRLKELVFTYFYKNMPAAEFRKTASMYATTRLPRIVKQSALDRIRWHRERNHRVIVVSASIELWLKDWCRALDLELIGTKVETQDGLITGRLATKNCYGPEKVRRIKAAVDLGKYDSIYAYGDSRGDREMLALAGKKFYRFFH